jgi:transcriptional regulator with XRE-family HTH domain
MELNQQEKGGYGVDNNLPEIVGKNIRSLREKRGLAQKFVAEKIGVKNNTLSGYEAGRRLPDADILQKLADFFEVSTDFLLGRTDDLAPIQQEQDEKPINVAFLGGRKEILTEDEAEAVEAALEIHRRLKEKRLREKNQK